MALETVAILVSEGDDMFLSSEVALPPGLAPPPGLTRCIDVSKEEDARSSPDSYAAPFPGFLSSSGVVEESDELGPPPGLHFAMYDQNACLAEGGAAVQPELVTTPTVSVTISGIPDKLLSEALVEVMLDQAVGGEALLSFSISRSGSSGCVSAVFANARAAHSCARHFHGRLWGPSKTPVQATVVLDSETAAPVSSLMSSQHSQPAMAQARKVTKTLSADAPVFVFSAGTPAFVPNFESKADAVCATGSGANSDRSTEPGESGSEDESRSPSKLRKQPVLVD